MSHESGETDRITVRPPSPRETDFMNSFAIPILDETRDEKSLEDLSEIFWNLCLLERQRAGILDTKASCLLGLSSIAGAVVAVGGAEQAMEHKEVMWASAVILALFTSAVIASLLALLGRKYGGFRDKAVFKSLRAHKEPVGPIKNFEDKNPRRCFLKEIILQRWLVSRWHSEANESKYKRLINAQRLAVLSVLSLFGYLGIILIIRSP